MAATLAEDTRLEALTDKVMRALVQGRGIGEATGALSEESSEAIYAQACVLHSQGDYERAEAAFGWLALRATPSSRLFMALGATRQARNRWDLAIEAYSLAALLDVENPAPSYHAAQCLLRMGDTARALKALEAAKAQAAHNPTGSEDIVARVEALEAFARSGEAA